MSGVLPSKHCEFDFHAYKLKYCFNCLSEYQTSKCCFDCHFEIDRCLVDLKPFAWVVSRKWYLQNPTCRLWCNFIHWNRGKGLGMLSGKSLNRSSTTRSQIIQSRCFISQPKSHWCDHHFIWINYSYEDGVFIGGDD